MTDAPHTQTPQSPPEPAARSRRRRRLFKAAILIFFVAGFGGLLALIGAEIAAIRYSAGLWGFFEADPELGWAYKPNTESDALIPSGDGHFRRNRVRINSLGFRDREFSREKPPGVKRIVCLGDSYVESMQVAEDELFTRRLEDEINHENGASYEVIAAGNGNYGLGQELIFYRTHVRQLSPDVVILFIYPLNDFMDINVNLNDQAYMPKPFFSLDENGNLVEPTQLQMPPRTMAVRHLNPITKWLYRLACYRVTLDYMRHYHKDFAALMVKCKLFPKSQEPTAQGYPLVNDVHLKEPGAEWDYSFRLAEKLVAKLKTEVEADGATLLGVVIPFTGFMDLATPIAAREMFTPLYSVEGMKLGLPEKRAGAIFEKLGVPCIDLTGGLLAAWERERGAKGDAARFPYNIDDGHWSAFGHEAVAEILDRFLLEQGVPGGSDSDAE